MQVSSCGCIRNLFFLEGGATKTVQILQHFMDFMAFLKHGKLHLHKFETSQGEDVMVAWRIGPMTDGYVVNLPMVIVSPLSGVVGPLPNGLFMAYE